MRLISINLNAKAINGLNIRLENQMMNKCVNYITNSRDFVIVLPAMGCNFAL
jgi:hypothetical protein